MENKNKERLIFTLKFLIPLLIVISLFIGGITAGIITFEKPNKIADNKQINATIIIDFGDGKIYSKDMIINNLTIFDFLLEVQKIGDGD